MMRKDCENFQQFEAWNLNVKSLSAITAKHQTE